MQLIWKQMIKKILPIFIILALFVGYSPSAFAATTPTAKKTVTTKTTSKKVTTKKKTTKKKKVVKKKEKLIANPPLITLDTAPHSPKPIAKAKKKTIKKTTTPKKKA